MFCPSCGAKIPVPTAAKKAPKALGSRSKQTIALAVIITILLIISGAYAYYVIFVKGTPGISGEPGITPAETIPPTSTAGPSVIIPTPTAGSTVVIPTPTEISLPATGVWVRVDYLGSWKGSYGKAGGLVPVADSGIHQYQVESPAGTIQASFRKDDGTNHELVVEIYRNGVLIKRGITTTPRGSVDISVTV
jgi:hypothetical protein